MPDRLTHTLISDFWQYYEPIRENMPKNCSADVEAVINFVDEVFFGSNTTAQRELQELFGFLTDLEVAQACTFHQLSNVFSVLHLMPL